MEPTLDSRVTFEKNVHFKINFVEFRKNSKFGNKSLEILFENLPNLLLYSLDFSIFGLLFLS